MKRKLDFPSLHNADAIVMLTWSDWFHELRSNRYHYATRFARSLPVIFVQPDLAEPTFCFEPTEVENVTVLHVYQKYDEKQSQLINFALMSVNCIRPLLWIYNIQFHHFIETRYSVLNVYHATEDYFSCDMPNRLEKKLLDDYANTLSNCQLIIAVSEGVRNSFLEHTNFVYNEIIIVTNGCDYQFYADNQLSLLKKSFAINNKKILYQGNILGKMDFELLIELAALMPDWTFQFCGRVVEENQNWQLLLLQPNVEYLGLLSPEELREKIFTADVALIPFVKADYIVARSFPLKAFEYLACGLPVVSTHIDALQPFSDVIHFANTAEEFSIAIQNAVCQKTESDIIKRQQAAALQDYEIKFSQVIDAINQINPDETSNQNLTISIIYNPLKNSLQKIMGELSIFHKYSKFDFNFIENDFTDVNQEKLNFSDIILIHQSVSIENSDNPYVLHAKYFHTLEKFFGYKILFYDEKISAPKSIEEQINNLGFHAVFCNEPDFLVKTNYINKLLRHNALQKLDSILPPFVLSNHDTTYFYKLNLLFRIVSIGFKQSDSVQGNINTLDAMLLEDLSKLAENNNILFDLDWDGNKLSVDQWYRFITTCNAIVLFSRGTELSKEIAAAIHFKVALIFPDGHAPKRFIPWTHYIPLKYDLSNFDEVLGILNNRKQLKIMTSKVLSDFCPLNNIILLKSNIQYFDELITQAVPYKRVREPIPVLPLPIKPVMNKSASQSKAVFYLKKFVPVIVKRQILKLTSA